MKLTKKGVLEAIAHRQGSHTGHQGYDSTYLAPSLQTVQSGIHRGDAQLRGGDS
jgi:hypothetical protein